VNILIFILAFFLDFFELSFIVVPLLGPVAIKLGIDPVWFGVLLAVNMQTSFMHPPFGFALFYLRSVAPNEDYKDRLTGRMVDKVTTGQIYWGAVPFVIIQLIMVSLIIAFPGIVPREDSHKNDLNQEQVEQAMQEASLVPEVDEAASAASGADDGQTDANDPMKALQDAIKRDEAKK